MMHTDARGILENRILELEDAEKALKARITALTRPVVATGDIDFSSLFDLDEIHRLQDQFASATGVASIITRPDGTPVTEPSNFCRLCSQVIRNTEKGRANCRKSDAAIGRFSEDGPTVQKCISGGLWDAGAAISVGGVHIANWLIGQVRDGAQSEQKIREYAREIGADEAEAVEAFREVPVMGRDQLEQVARLLFTLANQLSATAYQNVLQARRITELKDAKTILTEYRAQLEGLVGKRTEELSRKNSLLQQQITERNLLQEKLSHAMDIARLGPWEYDFYEDRFTFSDHFYRIYRTSAEKMGGYTMSSAEYIERFVHPEDAPFVRTIIREMPDTADGSRQTIEHRFRYADGSTGHIVVRCLLPEDPREETGKVHGVNQDITEHKLAEAEREQLLSAIEQVGEMVTITDSQGRIQYVNPAFEQVTGYHRDQVVGQKPMFLESEDPEGAFFNQAWEAVSNGQRWVGHTVHRRSDGTLFPVSASVTPVRDSTGDIVNYVSVKRDITEHLRLEDQLRQAQKMESVGRLAGGVAHDYNNMLGVILGHAELALEKVVSSDPLHRHLKAILDASRRSSSITRQLLAFARKQTIQPKVIDLNETVTPMLKMLRRLIGEQIDLAWMPGKNLWPVRMDPSQIDQILANLCVNAKDAVGEKGKLTIETEPVTLDEAYCGNHAGVVPGAYVMLAVSDNGCGMDSGTIEKIFEPFFTTKDASRGTGLGLSMVYGIVKQNSGFINVYSEPGKGTSFKIYLPRHDGGTVETTAAAGGEVRPARGETVLVVEDEELIIEMVERILQKLGYRVLTAQRPSIALDVAEMYAGEIDLLVTDVIMPEMNGRELATEFRTLYPDIKTLFMSGYTANVIVHQGVLDPGVHFLQKPFTIQTLAAKVQEALDGAAAG